VCDLLVADSVRGNGTEAGNHPASGIPSPGDRPAEQDDHQRFGQRPSPVAFAHPATGVWNRAISIAAMQARRYSSDGRLNGILLAPQRFHRTDAARRYSSRPAIPGPWLHHPVVCIRWAIIRPVNRIRYRVASSPVARRARQVGDCPSPRQHSSRRGAVPLCRACPAGSWVWTTAFRAVCRRFADGARHSIVV